MTWQRQEFIISMWCPPPANDEHLAILKRDGYNLTNVAVVFDVILPSAEALRRLDLAAKHNIKSLFSSSLFHYSTLDNLEKKAELDALIETLKTHPAFEGYHLIDEPSAVTFPAWARLSHYLKKRDPEHLAYMNLLPSYATQQQLGVFMKEPPTGASGIPDNFAGVGSCQDTITFYSEHLRQYLALIEPDLISYDHYHFLNLKDEPDGWQYFLNIELIKSAAQKAGLPFLNIVQACTHEPVWRLPNEHELRWLAYTTMAYGGRGISWFLYWGPASSGGLYQAGQRMPMADWVANVNREVKALGPQLMKLASTHVYHTAPLPIGGQGVPAGCPVTATGGEYVIGLFAEDGNENVFMIMNRNYQSASTARVTLNLGDGTLLAFSTAKGEWTESQSIAAGRVIAVELVPGGGKLFKVTG